MDLTLLSRMIKEVSAETLTDLLTEYSRKFNVDADDAADTLRVLDGIVSEFKARLNVVDVEPAARKRNYAKENERRKVRESNTPEAKADGGSLREESGKLQSGESGATTIIRVGNAAK